MVQLEWYVSFAVVLVGLLGFLFAGIPVSLSLAVVGFGGLFFLAGPDVAVDSITMIFHTAPTNFVLVAIPLFVLMAQVIISTGLATDVYDGVGEAFGKFGAGLPLATTGAGTVFAAVTGSSIASCAAIGPAAIKEMIVRGYDKRLVGGSVAAAGALAVIIPPSIPLILFGYVAETSVAKLFIAGVVPGILMAIGFGICQILWIKAKPGTAPAVAVESLGAWERLRPLSKVWPVVALACLMLGSIYFGITTPTEAAGVGVLGALLIALVSRKLTLAKFYEALLSAVRTTGFVLLIVVGALIFGFLMSYLRIPAHFTELVAAYGMPPLMLLLAAILVLLVMGCLMDSAGLVLVIVPLMLPAIVGAGMDLIWVGVVLVVMVEIGLVTPPVGLNLFVLSGVGKPYGVTYRDLVIGSLPFLVVDAIVVALVIAFPALATWLPNVMG